MPSLRETQTQWATALLSVPGAGPDSIGWLPAETRRLYESLLHGTIQECLSGIYPYSKRLLMTTGCAGDWAVLVEEYRRRHPATSYRLLDAVEAFPAYLAQVPTMPPYLPEIAMYEWLEAVVQHAPDPVMPPGFQAMLPPVSDWERFSPVWNTTGVVQPFVWPVTDMLAALTKTPKDKTPDLFGFSPRGLHTASQTVLIYRDPKTLRVRFFVLSELTAALLSALFAPGVSYRRGIETLQGQSSALDDAYQILSHCHEAGILPGSIPSV